MKNRYQVEIIETLGRILYVNALDEETAYQEVFRQHKDGEIVLDSNDYRDVYIEVVEIDSATCILCKFSADCDDEFDITGQKIFSQSEWLEFQRQSKVYFEKYGNLEIHFGSNQSLYFKNISELFECFFTMQISEDAYNELSKVYHKNKFGLFIDWDDIFQRKSEEEEI